MEKRKHRKPRYLQPETNHQHVVVIPWVQSSGAPGSRYEWMNAAQAALHAILQGLSCDKKKDARYWIEEASGHLNNSVAKIKTPRAKIPRYDTREQSTEPPPLAVAIHAISSIVAKMPQRSTLQGDDLDQADHLLAAFRRLLNLRECQARKKSASPIRAKSVKSVSKS